MKTLLIYLLFSNFTERLTVEEVREEITNQGIRHSDVVIRQVILEVGWTDHKYLNDEPNNNLFGFCINGKEIKYTHWKESVRYYKTWQDKHYPGRVNYYDWLNCMWISNGKCVRYASDKFYCNKLQKIRI